MTKVAVIGAGAIARRGHLPCWRRMSDVTVGIVADQNADLAKTVADEFEVPRWVTDYRDVLSDPAIEVVDICTPTPTHHRIVLESLAAGKHVLVEKPLTLSLKEALEILYKIKETDRQLCITQNYRYIESVDKAKAIAEGTRLGRVISIHGKALTFAPVGWTRSKWLYHPDAVLYDFTPHLIDLVLFLVNDGIKRVYAVGRNFSDYVNFLGSAQILVEFKSGPVALLDTSWTTNAPRFEIDVFGSGGFLSLHPMRDYIWEGHGTVQPLDETRSYIRKMATILKGVMAGNLSVKQMLAYQTLFSQFLASIEEGNQPPISIEQGVRIEIILEAAKRSIRAGQPIMASELLQEYGVPEVIRDQVLCI